MTVVFRPRPIFSLISPVRRPSPGWSAFRRLDFPTPELIAVASRSDLTEPELEGAARLFAGWDFGRRRPDDRKLLPADLKKKLLEHSLKTSDEDKIGRARHAFGEP